MARNLNTAVALPNSSPKEVRVKPIAASQSKTSAAKYAKKIMSALEEISANQKSKKAQKSLDDLLNEL